MALADACRDATVQMVLVHQMLDQMEKKNNPFGKIDDRDRLGETALRWACFNGRRDLVKLLIERNASVNQPNEIQQTPLHSASWNQYSACAQILLEAKADINVQDKDGCTPLHKACWKGNLDIAKLLLNANARADIVDVNGSTVLHYSAIQGNQSVVSLLLEKAVDINKRDKKGITALQVATTGGRIETVRLLLDNKANVEDTDNNGLTLLHRVCVKGFTNICEELILRGCNIRARDKHGTTPLHKAAASGHIPIIELLLNHGSDINVDDATGATPLHKACWAGKTEVVRWLIAHDAHKDRRDQKLVTPLQYACWAGHRDIVKLLLEQNSNPNTKDANGNSPLLDCCSKGYLSIIELLVAHKAEVKIVNKNNSTPLLEAVGNKRENVVRYLLNRFGVEVLGGNIMWNQAVGLAKKLQLDNVVQMLVQANSAEIVREGIHVNLKNIYRHYGELRERLGKAEFLCALIDRHGCYGKSKLLIEQVTEADTLLHTLLDGLSSSSEDQEAGSEENSGQQIDKQELAASYPEQLLYPASMYTSALQKIRDAFETFDVQYQMASGNSLLVGSTGVGAFDDQLSSFDPPAPVPAGSSNSSQTNSKSNSEDSQHSEENSAQEKKKQVLHHEIEQKLNLMLKQLEQEYPSPSATLQSSSSSIDGDLTVAIEQFNEWKIKVAREVVDGIKQVDLLSRQLHELLISGINVISEQQKQGEFLISQLVHSSLLDRQHQQVVTEKLKSFKSQQAAVRVLLQRAEKREEALRMVQMIEQRKLEEKRIAEERLQRQNDALARDRAQAERRLHEASAIQDENVTVQESEDAVELQDFSPPPVMENDDNDDQEQRMTVISNLDNNMDTEIPVNEISHEVKQEAEEDELDTSSNNDENGEVATEDFPSNWDNEEVFETKSETPDETENNESAEHNHDELSSNSEDGIITTTTSEPFGKTLEQESLFTTDDEPFEPLFADEQENITANTTDDTNIVADSTPIIDTVPTVVDNDESFTQQTAVAEDVTFDQDKPELQEELALEESTPTEQSLSEADETVVPVNESNFDDEL